MKKLNSILSLILFAAAALNAQTVTVDKTSMTFSAQAGGSPVSQTLGISGAAGQQFFVFSDNNVWLKVKLQGDTGAGSNSVGATTPATIVVTADPTGLAPLTYSTTLRVFAQNGPTIPVGVTFTVGSVGISPSTVAFTYQSGGMVPNPVSLTLTSATPVNFTAAATTASGGAWLSVSPNSGTSPATLTVALNSTIITGLAIGSYSGTVTVTPAAGPPISVGVTLNVAAAPTVTKSADTINLNYQVGGATGSTNTPSATLTLTNPGVQDLPFGVVVSPNGTWLSATPPSGTIPANGSAAITISYVTTTNLAPATYNGQVSVFVPNAANSTINVPVNLRVSNSPLLNVPNGTLAFTYQLGGATPAAKTVIATSSQVAADATSGQMALLLTKSTDANWLVIPTSGQTGSASPISVTVNPAGLAVGAYNATISIIGGGAANNPQTIPVTLTVSNDPMIVATYGGCSSAISTCTLSFPIQVGQNSPTTQNVRVTSSTGAQASFSATATMATSAACGTSWLTTGVTAAVVGAETTFPITVVPGTIAPGTTCEGAITIAGTNPTTGTALPNSPISIPVKMYISSNAMLVASPIALNFTTTTTVTPPAQSITVTSTSATNLDFNATTSSSAPWLLAFPLARNTATGSNVINVLVNPSGLNPGNYTASITLTATAAGVQNSPVTIPVTLTVNAATMTLAPTTLSFSQALGATPPAAKTFTVSTNSTDIVFLATVATQQGSGWLSATPSTGTATSATPATVTVNVNGSNLPAGTYNGTVTVASPTAAGSPATVNVTLTVLAGTLSATPASLAFDQVQGGTAPAAKTIAVAGTPGALAYTVAVSTEGNSGNWLTATPASGTTNSNVQVSVNSGSLAVGQYRGKVTITSTGAQGSPVEVPVTLNVIKAETFTVSPTTPLSFSYVIGSAATLSPQTVQLTSSSSSATFTAAATTSGGGNWLTVTPTSGTGSGTLTIGVNTATLTNAGTYTGTVAITSPNSATNPAASITVNLTVTAIPKPVIQSISNAASYVSGAVSPGENIVIFGSGIGPATLTLGTLTNNTFATTIGNTQVFFDNIPAPIIYARADQTSVMVPYGVAGRTTTSIRIVYSGVQSDAIPYNVFAAAPGVYTANASGSGQGAILNQDFSFNGSSRPAAKGSVVALYLTGEGTTSPSGVDGRIAPSDGTGLYKPILPVTATVGGQTATVEYYGTAPGIVYGVMQVNVRIPATAATGNLPVVVNVGSNATQGNVTVAVQ